MTMSDGLDDYRDEPEAAESDPKDAPQLFYGSVDEFVRERLIHMYARKVGGGNARRRWAADYWNYPEALSRLESLWRAWEHLRLDPATGMSAWWRDHADHHMEMLMDPEGPFGKSEDQNDWGEPLPYEPPATGLFPDVRLG